MKEECEIKGLRLNANKTKVLVFERDEERTKCEIWVNQECLEQVISRAQNGCRGGGRGTKEPLLIDVVIGKVVKRNRRNLSAAWIDYKKAFDSVPHTWLKSVLELYKVDCTVRDFLWQCMGQWSTILCHLGERMTAAENRIRIRRGIFQGDCLSPIWFCLSLNPLSILLEGFRSRSHLMELLNITCDFGNSIRMELGTDKCAVHHVERGRVANSEGIDLSMPINIKTLSEAETPIPGIVEIFKKVLFTLRETESHLWTSRICNNKLYYLKDGGFVSRSNIKKISQNVSSMSKMVNQLQTPQDSQELRNQLRQIQNYTQKLAKDTSSLLMELMKLPVDQPAQKLQRDRLSDEYLSTLNAFQSTQRSAAQKSKEDVRKVKAQNINIGDPFAMNANNKELLEMGDTNVRKQEQLTMQSERELLELEERERDIRQLESDILDVNQIFKDLGTMIHDQGAVVDSIESNVEYAVQNVESGTQELRQAVNYKNKLRKKKVYIAIILIIIISILLIVIFHR
ncbi:unnamed protein product [Parnassius mnemosyne]|uniref:t-SNARE coiled-coil homology domain-containing protein n=1 Tax=Parnassius mnemosyne TaxID=213953 RepID=A0AAV1KZH4_9NEOP